jgi:hypothetical protein
MRVERQLGLFDVDERAAKLTAMGDPLVKLKEEIDFEAFRPDLNSTLSDLLERRHGASGVGFLGVLA